MLSLLGQAWRGSRCEVGEMVGFEVQEGVYGAGVLCLERLLHSRRDRMLHAEFLALAQCSQEVARKG